MQARTDPSIRHAAAWMLIAALVAPLVCGPSESAAEHLSEWPAHDPGRAGGEAIVSLHSRELQAISRDLGFRVSEASVKDQQLWVIGEVTNRSRKTYSRVRLVVGIAHGAQLRISLGRLVPGASRRTQVRLATDFAHAPQYLRVLLVEASSDYRPEPLRRRRMPSR